MSNQLILLLTSLPALASFAAVAPAPKAPAANARRAVAPSMILLEPVQTFIRQRQRMQQDATVLGSFLQHFTGHFDNHAQCVANEAAGLTPRHGGGHEHIHCALQPVKVEGAGPSTAHVLASYYFNGQPTAIFRERLYEFSALEADAQFGSCVRMAIYKLREPIATQLGAAGEVAAPSKSDDVAFAADLDLAQELHVAEADVFWRQCGDRYEGRMREEAITIVSERSGAEIVVRDDVTLFADELWVNDRGHDAQTGEYVYGNIHSIPYKLSRVADSHWTVTGEEPPPSA